VGRLRLPFLKPVFRPPVERGFVIGLEPHRRRLSSPGFRFNGFTKKEMEKIFAKIEWKDIIAKTPQQEI
jgi:hypothetical protein